MLLAKMSRLLNKKAFVFLHLKYIVLPWICLITLIEPILKS